MFKLNPSPTFVAQVPLSVPGMPEPLDIAVTFKHKNKTALKAWMAGASGKDDAVVLNEVISGWSGLQDDAGAEVPYSITSLTELLNNYAASHGELFRAYLRELTEAKRKNS